MEPPLGGGSYRNEEGCDRRDCCQHGFTLLLPNHHQSKRSMSLRIVKIPRYPPHHERYTWNGHGGTANTRRIKRWLTIQVEVNVPREGKGRRGQGVERTRESEVTAPRHQGGAGLGDHQDVSQRVSHAR